MHGDGKYGWEEGGMAGSRAATRDGPPDDISADSRGAWGGEGRKEVGWVSGVDSC